MRIYQPVRGVGAALREDSFMIIDDAGVEIGQGGLEYRVYKKMFEDRPLEIEMIMNAHPAASDTLYGALMARAERIKAAQGGVPGRLFTRCSVQDAQKYNYFLNMGFDDKDGMELFVYTINGPSRKKNYNPIGTKFLDVDLHTRVRREEFLHTMAEFGDEPHAEQWLSEQMRGQVFIAKQIYYGNEPVGFILVTGNQSEAMINMMGVEKKWRGRGVGASLIDEVLAQLALQKVPYLTARTQRRNQPMLRLLRRCQFQWVRTEELFLGRDL